MAPALGCGMQCIRSLLFAFNFLFALSGIGIIVCGGYSLHWYKKTGPIVEGNYVAAPVTLIVVGVIVFLVASLGCFGAMKRIYCALMLFSVLLSVILVLEITAGVLGFVYKRKFQELGEKHIKKSMDEYYRTDKLNPIKFAWDFMQKTLVCCGTYGPKDWGKRIPGSCCKEGGDTCTKKNAYPRGCFALLKEKLKSYAVYLGITGVVLGLIQIAGIVFACCLSKQTPEE